jgi:hypothetical protein
MQVRMTPESVLATAALALAATGLPLPVGAEAPPSALAQSDLEAGDEPAAEAATDAPGEQEPAAGAAADAETPKDHADQSGMETPAAFRFPGQMASVWTRGDVEGIRQDTPVTMPLMIHPDSFFEQGIYVWDAWPIRNPDGSVAEIDGWVVKVGLSAEWNEVDETGWEFFTLSTWRYWFTRDGEWRPGGVIFYDPETQEVTFYYTAVGRPDAGGIDDDMPDRAISIHNEAAGRPRGMDQRAACADPPRRGVAPLPPGEPERRLLGAHRLGPPRLGGPGDVGGAAPRADPVHRLRSSRRLGRQPDPGHGAAGHPLHRRRRHEVGPRARGHVARRRLPPRRGAVAYDTPPGYQDMRDPWIVRTDDGWLALVGSGTRAHDAALILAWTSRDAVAWAFAGEFDTGGAEMPGSYWELPVLRPIGDRLLLMGTPVIPDARTRTFYWIGDFDGARFRPDDPSPRSFDLFGTLLAPTLASDRERLVAIGVIPDEGQRCEAVRQDAGKVHALGPPHEIALCPERPQTLCARLAPEVRSAFQPRRLEQADVDLEAEAVRIDLGSDPAFFRAELVVEAGSSVEIGLRIAPDDAEATALLLRPDEGRALLDNRRGSVAPWGRSDILRGELAPVERVVVELLVDGAVISGTVAGRPLGVMIHSQGEDATLLGVKATGPARMLWGEVGRL